MSVVHATHVPLPTAPRQTGVVPEQTLPFPPGLQTQALFTQALLFPVHSLSVRQPAAQVWEAAQYCPLGQSVLAVHRTQVFVTGLQTGFVGSVQSVLAVQATQVLVDVLQTEVVPAH